MVVKALKEIPIRSMIQSSTRVKKTRGYIVEGGNNVLGELDIAYFDPKADGGFSSALVLVGMIRIFKLSQNLSK